MVERVCIFCDFLNLVHLGFWEDEVDFNCMNCGERNERENKRKDEWSRREEVKRQAG